jgi:hypothetical protein
MLEEVEVAPGELFEVMRLARAPTGRAGIERAALSLDAKVKPVRHHFDIKRLRHDFSRRRKPQSQGKEFVGVHADKLKCDARNSIGRVEEPFFPRRAAPW